MNFISLGLFFVFSLSFEVSAMSPIGEVVGHEGAAKKISIDGTVTPVKMGIKVFERDLFEVDDGLVRVQFFDGHRISILAGSEVKITRYKKEKKSAVISTINLFYGRVRSLIKEKKQEPKEEKKKSASSDRFRVHTPTAVAGVRGTDFLVAFNKVTQTTELTTFKGRVALGKLMGGKIINAQIIGAGQRARQKGQNSPTKPERVPKKEMQKMKQEVKGGSQASKARGMIHAMGPSMTNSRQRPPSHSPAESTRSMAPKGGQQRAPRPNTTRPPNHHNGSGNSQMTPHEHPPIPMPQAPMPMKPM